MAQCGINMVSSLLCLTLKSSRACAPRLSFRASAEYIVWAAFNIKFFNSIASMRSVFHTIPRSNNFRSSNFSKHASIFSQPSFRTDPVRNTAAFVCITWRKFETDKTPYCLVLSILHLLQVSCNELLDFTSFNIKYWNDLRSLYRLPVYTFWCHSMCDFLLLMDANEWESYRCTFKGL